MNLEEVIQETEFFSSEALLLKIKCETNAIDAQIIIKGIGRKYSSHAQT